MTGAFSVSTPSLVSVVRTLAQPTSTSQRSALTLAPRAALTCPQRPVQVEC